MNSFDFYDTLVARRTIKDSLLKGQDEIDNLIPIKENIIRVQKNDIIISDYDYPAIVERGAKEICNLSNLVYVTQDGKLTGEIWKALKPDVHTGDNPHSDVLTPSNAGIKTILVTTAQPTASENLLRNTSIHSVIREQRLRTYNPKLRDIELLQIEINFPLLFLASILLHNKMESEGLTRVLMSSRDCFLWTRLQEKVCKILGGKYDVHYFYTSRIARNEPSEPYLRYVNNVLTDTSLVVDLCGYGHSLPRLIARTDYPLSPILLMGKYTHPELNHCERMVHISESYIERLNLARHPQVVDFNDGPVYHNPAMIDWEGSERIKVAHDTFLGMVDLLTECRVGEPIVPLMTHLVQEITNRKEQVLKDDVVILEP